MKSLHPAAVEEAQEILNAGADLSAEDRRTLTLCVSIGAPTSPAARDRIFRLWLHHAAFRMAGRLAAGIGPGPLDGAA